MLLPGSYESPDQSEAKIELCAYWLVLLSKKFVSCTQAYGSVHVLKSQQRLLQALMPRLGHGPRDDKVLTVCYYSCLDQLRAQTFLCWQRSILLQSMSFRLHTPGGCLLCRTARSIDELSLTRHCLTRQISTSGQILIGGQLSIQWTEAQLLQNGNTPLTTLWTPISPDPTFRTAPMFSLLLTEIKVLHVLD